MKVILAGGGKIGQALAQQLSTEGHDLTLIDLRSQVLEAAQERYDAITVSGNCASMQVLLDAGVSDADLLIAVTGADELNLLCCMTAHGINPNLHTIARIRNPEYSDQIMNMRGTFPLSLIVNPERDTAIEIQRLLRYPGFLRRDTFAKGRTEIVELRIDRNSKLCNIQLSHLSNVIKCRVLVCAVLRAGSAVAPSGNFVLQEGDRIFVTAPAPVLSVLLRNLDIITHRVRKVLLCGGGRVSYYLASLLEKDGIRVHILEKDEDRCVELASMLPDATIIQGDCSNHAFLEAQRLSSFDAVVTLTGLDETNMVLSLYAGKQGVKQIITKLGSLVCPKELSTNTIIRYVRAMQNQVGAAISIHTIADGQAEAVEFLVTKSTHNQNIPLKEMKLKSNVLIASIRHGSQTHIPNGDSSFTEGDIVVVVTSGRQILYQLNDIFA